MIGMTRKALGMCIVLSLLTAHGIVLTLGPVFHHSVEDDSCLCTCCWTGISAWVILGKDIRTHNYPQILGKDIPSHNYPQILGKDILSHNYSQVLGKDIHTHNYSQILGKDIRPHNYPQILGKDICSHNYPQILGKDIRTHNYPQILGKDIHTHNYPQILGKDIHTHNYSQILGKDIRPHNYPQILGKDIHAHNYSQILGKDIHTDNYSQILGKDIPSHNYSQILGKDIRSHNYPQILGKDICSHNYPQILGKDIRTHNYPQILGKDIYTHNYSQILGKDIHTNNYSQILGKDIHPHNYSEILGKDIRTHNYSQILGKDIRSHNYPQILGKDIHTHNYSQILGKDIRTHNYSQILGKDIHPHNYSQILGKDIHTHNYPQILVKDIHTHNYSQILGKFVSNTLKQHQGKLTSDQLMVLMVSQVSEKSGHAKPHNLFLEPRKWRQSCEDRKDIIKDFTSENMFDSIEWQRPVDRQELDNVIGDQDLRYFVSDSSNIQDMETAVLDNPHNIPIWLKLAHKKLHDPNSGSETCLDHALNVLARGLEENKDSADLWQGYLSLYAKHKESSDLQQLCETALEYTQSYTLWWQYLNVCTSCQQKQEVCDQMLEYVRLAEDRFPQEVRSHWVLEVILYKTSLYVWTGKFKAAIKHMQSVLKTEEKLRWISKCLVTNDQCLLWVSYVHLKEMKVLPTQLYDPLNQMSGRIVNKTDIMIDWTSKESLTTAVTILVELLNKAISCCVGRIEVNNPLVDQGGILYLNLFNLLKCQERYEEAADLCRPILQAKSTMVNIWLCVAELYALYDDEQTRQVFADALGANEFCAKLYHYAANFELSQREEDKALECLEQSIISYYDVSTTETRFVDPNQLFCVLLDEAVPLTFQPPPYKEGVTGELIKADLPYLWLNYCTLLELQGDDVQAVETYETALSTLTSVVDITRVWSSYIGFQNRRLKLQRTVSPDTARSFYDLVRRAVSCIPTKYEVPYCDGVYWFDYRHVNMVIQQYMACLPLSHHTTSYSKFLSLLPDNMDLLLQACGHAVGQDDLQTARGLCTTATLTKSPNLLLWNMLISLTSRLEGRKEVRRIFHKAVQALPYSAPLWKDYLLFEVTQRSSEVLPKIIQKCRDIGIPIQEYADFLTKPS
ncbi:Zinc finger C3H1 domain-containing protein [Mizuhopecten yessoensis]|uniref:Zinc finger C3H1 domain-containing protein n=1 Tax=Mizuhopecten yessoensis TaxID=6573 RepID=A0A210PUK7_MIZYE|nr:Zinc finger C3H1 domain-containing protein [Mizuhopecten yessoensis]